MPPVTHRAIHALQPEARQPHWVSEPSVGFSPRQARRTRRDASSPVTTRADRTAPERPAILQAPLDLSHRAAASSLDMKEFDQTTVPQRMRGDHGRRDHDSRPRLPASACAWKLIALRMCPTSERRRLTSAHSASKGPALRSSGSPTIKMCVRRFVSAIAGAADLDRIHRTAGPVLAARRSRHDVSRPLIVCMRRRRARQDDADVARLCSCRSGAAARAA